MHTSTANESEFKGHLVAGSFYLLSVQKPQVTIRAAELSCDPQCFCRVGRQRRYNANSIGVQKHKPLSRLALNPNWDALEPRSHPDLDLWRTNTKSMHF